jgi:predicted O-methyltransferase YrrM
MKLNFAHLKDFSSYEGYWSTIDCLEVSEDILNTTGAKSIIEIGFNIGYSAACWLENGATELFAVDIGTHKDTLAALQNTKDFYNRAKIGWVICDSKKVDSAILPKADLVFIDGEHSYEAVISDSKLAFKTGAKWLVYDDVIPNHENGIYKALETLEQENKLYFIKTYPMTWTNQGHVVLAGAIT